MSDHKKSAYQVVFATPTVMAESHTSAVSQALRGVVVVCSHAGASDIVGRQFRVRVLSAEVEDV